MYNGGDLANDRTYRHYDDFTQKHNNKFTNKLKITSFVGLSMWVKNGMQIAQMLIYYISCIVKTWENNANKYVQEQSKLRWLASENGEKGILESKQVNSITL